MSDNQTPITDEMAAFAQDVVAVCRKHGLSYIHVSDCYNVNVGSPFRGRFSFSWSNGRHGDSSKITMKSEATRHVMEAHNG